MEKLGLFGGTFAPPHLGHVRAARMMLEEIQPDRLLIMPTAIPPHKVKVKGDTPELRLEMCRAAFGELPGTEVSDYEIVKGGVSYTVQTLEYLTAPEREIYLLCGTDMFLTLPRWYRAERIFDLAKIVCIPRDSLSREELLDRQAEYERDFGADVRILSAEPLELSSTELRQRIVQGGELSEWLSPGVIDVIRRESLYQENETT